MFKESDKNAQLDIFSTPAEHLRGSSQKFYLKDDSCHNIFRGNVLSHINEQIFSVLYCKDNGTPNASIRVLVAMMLLKKKGNVGAMINYSRIATIIYWYVALWDF